MEERKRARHTSIRVVACVAENFEHDVQAIFILIAIGPKNSIFLIKKNLVPLN